MPDWPASNRRASSALKNRPTSHRALGGIGAVNEIEGIADAKVAADGAGLGFGAEVAPISFAKLQWRPYLATPG